MSKRLLLPSAVMTAILMSACTQTESALTDENDRSVSEQETATSVEITVDQPRVNRISTAENQPAEILAPPQQVAKSVSPQHETRPVPQQQSVVRTPFPVKRCMNLGNALEAPNEGEWGYTIREKDLRTIAKAGFDTIRLPVRWDTHTANRAPYQIDPVFMARVQTIVSQARTAGLGVIVDVHHFENLISHPRRQEARFIAMWSQIASAFADAPSSVYFEVLNEPTLEINMTEVNALYAKVIPVIRTSNPTRKIIMGGNSWNSVESLAEVNWPKDPNIVATFHDYGPHAFTHQGAEWSEPVMPLGRRWGGKEDANELKSTYDIANAFRARTGLPILVGEFGVIDKVPQPQRMQWTKIRRQTMEKNDMAWCVWDFSGAFKSYDLSTERWLPGVQDALFAR